MGTGLTNQAPLQFESWHQQTHHNQKEYDQEWRCALQDQCLALWNE